MRTEALRKELAGAAGERKLREAYPLDAPAQQARYIELLDWFTVVFGSRDAVFVSAPGRAEIAGNHTDHEHGRVLAAAVNLDTIACVSKNDDMRVTLYSEGYDEAFCVDLTQLALRESEKETTSSLIRGVAARLAELGYPIGGFDACVTSTVFKGSGLSSSAAFEVMLLKAFEVLYPGDAIDAKERARICQFAENVYFGKPSGLLDQTASSVGGLVTMNFARADAGVEALQYDFYRKGYVPVVVNARCDHGELTNHYALVTQEMQAVARLLGGKVLGDVPFSAFDGAIADLKGKVGDRALLRAYHFYDEDARVPVMVDALKNDDIDLFLRYVIASGESSWKLLQNVYVPGAPDQGLALALELSRRMLDGRGAWRIHGGGFAGTILAFVRSEDLDMYRARMDGVFGAGAVCPLSIRPVGAWALENV